MNPGYGNQNTYFGNPNMGMYGQPQPQPISNRGTTGYANPSLGMMMQNNGFGGGPGYMQPNNNINNNQTGQGKDRQIQQLKSTYPNLQHKQVHNNNQPLDFVELSMQIQTSEVRLQVPLALILDNRFPIAPPKIYIRSKLKHNLFDVKDQIIELDVNNVTQWNPQQTTLSDIMAKCKTLFEQDPPKQEKIIEEVNKYLSVVTEQNFRELVEGDVLSSRNVDDLRQLQGISFQELICSSGEYKKIGQNLIDVINFNEKVANELLQKKEDLEQHKQQLALITDRIEALNRDYNDRAAKCKGFKEAFSVQNIDGFITKEIKNLDSQSLNLESIAQSSSGNNFDILQQYFDTRKNFHKLNILKLKIPEMKNQQ